MESRLLAAVGRGKPEHATDSFGGDQHLGFYRFDGDIEDVGHFRVFQPFLAYELEYELTPAGQVIYFPLHHPAHFGGDEQQFRIGGKADVRNVHLFEEFPVAGTFNLQPVERGVFDGPEQVGFHMGDFAELVPFAPEFQEYVVDRFGGGGLIFEVYPSKAAKIAGHGPVQRTQRVFVRHMLLDALHDVVKVDVGGRFEFLHTPGGRLIHCCYLLQGSSICQSPMHQN